MGMAPAAHSTARCCVSWFCHACLRTVRALRGAWAPVSLASIKFKELPVSRAEAGQSAGFLLHLHSSRIKLRRGMVLVDATAGPPPAAGWEFDARVTFVQLTSPASAGTELVVHSLGVKQAAKILSVDGGGESGGSGGEGGDNGGSPVQGGQLRQGVEAAVRLRFVHAAEFVLEGASLVVRGSGGAGAAPVGAHNLCLGVGLITRVQRGEQVDRD